MVRTRRSHCQSPGPIPGWGTKIPQAVQHGKKKKKKDTIKKVKRQPTKWEKIFANHVSDKGLVSRLSKGLLQHSNRMKNNSVLKTGTALEQTQLFLQRYTYGQQANEKMYNITSHQGNENENHNKTLLHIHLDGRERRERERENSEFC